MITVVGESKASLGHDQLPPEAATSNAKYGVVSLAVQVGTKEASDFTADSINVFRQPIDLAVSNKAQKKASFVDQLSQMAQDQAKFLGDADQAVVAEILETLGTDMGGDAQEEEGEGGDSPGLESEQARGVGLRRGGD